MKQRMLFTNFLMSILVVCTIMYQSVHSLTHVLEDIHHSYVTDDSDHSHSHIDSKHCHVCDFSFSPFTSVEFQTITFLNPTQVSQKYFFSEQAFDLTLNQHSFLRGPPEFI